MAFQSYIPYLLELIKDLKERVKSPLGACEKCGGVVSPHLVSVTVHPLISRECEPPMKVYNLLVETRTGMWNESMGHMAFVDAFVRGVKAGASLSGTRVEVHEDRREIGP